MQFKQEDGTSYTATQGGHLDFNIVNETTAAQDMTLLQLKFYFLTEGVLTSPTMACTSFSGGACSAVSPSFVAFAPAKSNADEVLKINFTSGSIPAGGSASVRVVLSNSPAATFDETKFYSYVAADTTYADAPNVTLYVSGTLVWGTHP